MRGSALGFVIVIGILVGGAALSVQFISPTVEITSVDSSESGAIVDVSYDRGQFHVHFEGSQVRAINLIGPNGEIIGQKDIVLGQQSVSFFLDKLGDHSGEYTIVAEGDGRDLLGRVVVELSEV